MTEPHDRRDRLAQLLLYAAPLAVLALAGGIVLAQNVPGAPNTPAHRVLPPARVDWTAVAADYKRGAAAELRRSKGFLASEQSLDALPLPVLLPHPNGQVTTGALVFMSYGDGYDINIAQPQAPGVTILLGGSRIFVDAGDQPLNLPKSDRISINGKPQTVFVSQTETGQTASFSRYGMVYTIDVDCDGPAMGSAYCENPAYIRSVAADMSDIVLGGQAEGEMLKATGGSKLPPGAATMATTKANQVTDKVKTPANTAKSTALSHKVPGR